MEKKNWSWVRKECLTPRRTGQLAVGRNITLLGMALLDSRVEAGKNTSTAIPASLKRRRKGKPVVSDDIVMYGYVSSATLTTDRLHYKLQTRPLVG
jgi:hypothetical protein